MYDKALKLVGVPEKLEKEDKDEKSDKEDN